MHHGLRVTHCLGLRHTVQIALLEKVQNIVLAEQSLLLDPGIHVCPTCGNPLKKTRSQRACNVLGRRLHARSLASRERPRWPKSSVRTDKKLGIASPKQSRHADTCRSFVKRSSSHLLRNHAAIPETLLLLTFLDVRDTDLVWHMRCTGSRVSCDTRNGPVRREAPLPSGSPPSTLGPNGPWWQRTCRSLWRISWHLVRSRFRSRMISPMARIGGVV